MSLVVTSSLSGKLHVTPQAAIKISLEMADYVCQSYLSDLSDTELMHRPHPQCNHLNWQVGHLIVSEHQMMETLKPGSMPKLPEGMAEMYSRETVGCNDASKFASKELLMKTHQEQRAATLKGLAATTADDLDKPTGVDYAPTVGAMYAIQGSHWLMHCGQWVIVRRELGKSVVI